MRPRSYRRNRRLSAAALWLLAVAIAFRAFVPPGFMPNQGGEAGEFIVICSAGVLKTLRIEPEETAPDPDSPAVEDPCPFGVLASAALNVARAAQVWFPTTYRRLDCAHADSVCAEHFSCHVRRPRGPPVQI